jgi:hypothetical protein
MIFNCIGTFARDGCENRLNRSQQRNDIQLSSSKAKHSIREKNCHWRNENFELKTLDSTIASFIHENALSFNVADSPSFAAVVDQCIQFGQRHPRPKYKVPNRRRIGSRLLDSAHEDAAASVQPIMDRAKWYGGTLRLRNWCKFIPIVRQWQQLLVTTSRRCSRGIMNDLQTAHGAARTVGDGCVQ